MRQLRRKLPYMDLKLTETFTVTPVSMGGAPIKIVEDNEHLGQIVSGTNQTEKNIDLRL